MTGVLMALLLPLVAAGVVFLRHKPAALAAFMALALAPLLFASTSGALVTTTLALGVLFAQPLFAVLGVLTLVCFEFLSEVPPFDYGIFPEKIFELTDKNVLLAIPFFVVSGTIMTRGGIASRLINVAAKLTSFLPGGMAISAIGGCVLFAAISGSSPVTVIAIGSMMYPALTKAGFGERASIGLLTSAGSLGIVIPPSIPMIIYAIVVSGTQPIDVGDLFLAGIGPGAVIGGLLAALVIAISLYRSTKRGADLRRMGVGLAIIAAPLIVGEIIAAFTGPWGHALGPLFLCIVGGIYARESVIDGFWALMLPVLILGGIYSGLFTPTEAAAVAVVYALLVAVWIHRELTWGDLPELVVESTVMLGALIVIMVIAFVFNDYLADEQIPNLAAAAIGKMELSRNGFLIALNIFLLIVGCFMDIMSAILIVAPLVVPMALAPGIEIDPIHLGIIFIVNLEIGYLTPPLGLNLFVASTLFRKPIGEVIRSVAPYMLVMLAGVLFITYVPSVSLAPGRWLNAVTADADDGGGSNAAAPDHDAKTAEPAKKGVLSIQELMKAAADDEDEDAGDVAAPPAPSGKVLSIQELMQQAEQDSEDDDEDDDAPADD